MKTIVVITIYVYFKTSQPVMQERLCVVLHRMHLLYEGLCHDWPKPTWQTKC